MATFMVSLLPFSLSLLLLCHGSLAQSHRQFGDQNECRIEKLSAQEPIRRIKSEAGITELFDDNNEQFECAGVSAQRRTIEPKGLLLPSFSNSPRIVYIVQGRGISGTVVPGCPETFQSFQQREPRRKEGQQFSGVRDQHQRVNRFREGDILAIPAGVAHWCYNDGDSNIIAVTVFDTSSNANQLDQNRRQFMLAGSQQRSQQSRSEQTREEDSSSDNILSGFDTDALSEAMGIKRELAEKIKGRKDQRGEIVSVEDELHIVRPSRTRQEREESESEEERERERERGTNGLEQAFCTMRIKENIDDPTRADIYNPHGGRITNLNSQKLPILRHIQMSATRTVLYRNAMVAPHWNINAHSVMYVTGGRARVQIVSNRGTTAFDGEVRRGQIVVVPQNFAVLIRASSEGFEYVALKTNDRAMISPIVGKTSVMRAMPKEVLMNAYLISSEEAMSLKANRGEEMIILRPTSSQGIRASA